MEMDASDKEARVHDGALRLPRVTVVIPTYNRAEFLPRAIHSVLSQTYRDLELIVVDDASTDVTADVVRGIGDQRLRYIRLLRNGGLCRARNEGLRMARGEFAAFLDDDDEYRPAMLETLVARLDASPDASACYCRVATVGPDGPIARVSTFPVLPEGLLLDNYLLHGGGAPIYCGAYVIRRSALHEVGGFDETIPSIEDRELWVRLSFAGHEMAAVDEQLVVQHVGHKARMSGDAALMLRGMAMHWARWRRLARARLAAERFESGVAARKAWLKRLQRKEVKRLVRSGNRRRAWHYLRSVLPVARIYPWVAPYALRAFAVSVFGRQARRLPGVEDAWMKEKAAKRKREAATHGNVA